MTAGFRAIRVRSVAGRFAGVLFLLGSALLSGISAAQAPDAPIESAWAIWEDDQVMDRLEALYASGESLDVAETRKALRSPTPATIEPAPRRTQEIWGSDVARHARKSFLRLGWFGGESEDDLGLYLGAGFAVDDDVFLTCRHVVAPAEIKVGCLAAIDLTGKVYPVEAVLGADRISDAALVRVRGTPCEPLPLSTDAAPGDRVYCFSEPLDAYGYFDEGIVNRFFRLPPPERRPIAEDAPALVRMHVSVDWAPGSSGAATLDRYGNAVGIVSAVQTLSEDAPFIPYFEPETPEEERGGPEKAPAGQSGPTPSGEPSTAGDDPAFQPQVEKGSSEQPPAKPRRRAKAPTLMVLHEATPAKAALLLIERTNAAFEAQSVPEGATSPAKAASDE